MHPIYRTRRYDTLYFKNIITYLCSTQKLYVFSGMLYLILHYIYVLSTILTRVLGPEGVFERLAKLGFSSWMVDC